MDGHANSQTTGRCRAFAEVSPTTPAPCYRAKFCVQWPLWVIFGRILNEPPLVLATFCVEDDISRFSAGDGRIVVHRRKCEMEAATKGILGSGAVGGVAMPLIAAAQGGTNGTGLGPAFASEALIIGWAVGVIIFAVIGSFVGWLIVRHSHPYLKALAIGLTLPATLTAIGHGSDGAAAQISQSSWNIISTPARAQQKPAVGAERNGGRFVVIDNANAVCHGDCRVIFFGKDGKPLSISQVPTGEHKETKPIPVPENARAVRLLATAGSVAPTAIPTNFAHGTAIVTIESRSLFWVGLRKALGSPLAPYETILKYQSGPANKNSH